MRGDENCGVVVVHKSHVEGTPRNRGFPPSWISRNEDGMCAPFFKFQSREESGIEHRSSGRRNATTWFKLEDAVCTDDPAAGVSVFFGALTNRVVHGELLTWQEQSAIYIGRCLADVL